MSDSIPNLWPKEFKVDVQTPYTILKVQAGYLGQVTRGILEAEVETESSPNRVQHRLVVIAPAWKGYRHTLVTAIHDPNLPYPAEVRAEALARPVEPVGVAYPRANDDDDMRSLVANALRSDQTKAVIISLISKSNEVISSPSPALQGDVVNPETSESEARPSDAKSKPTD
jgi:hypothetical protein